MSDACENSIIKALEAAKHYGEEYTTVKTVDLDNWINALLSGLDRIDASLALMQRNSN